MSGNVNGAQAGFATVERAALVIGRAAEAGHSARDIARALADAGLLADESANKDRQTLDVLRARVEDAGSMMVTSYVREALDGGTARSVAEYTRANR